MRHKICFIICCFALLFYPGSISPVMGQIKAPQLTRQFQTAFLKDSLPGLAVVLVDKKGIIYQKQFGFADIQAHQSYSIHTVQPIGSVSKMILAVAVMKAVELGYFTLDTKINQILPFKVVNPYQPDHEITVRELTTHTSGIIDNPAIYPNTYKFHLQLRPYSEASMKPLAALSYQQKIKDSTLQEFYHNYLAADGRYYSKDNFVNSTEGITSVYSNIATALAGYMIEIKSGMSYSDFTAKYIFRPLHMNESGWFTTSLKISTQAKLYYDSELYFPLFDLITYPDGGLKTSASDLSKFLTDVIKGTSGKSVLLKAESFQTMFTPQFSAQHPPARINLERRNKGILWNLYTNGTIGHDGDDPGVSTYLLFNPSTGLGGLFMTNKFMENKSPVSDIISKAISNL